MTTMNTKMRREYLIGEDNIGVYEITSIEYIIVNGEISARNDPTNNNKSRKLLYYFEIVDNTGWIVHNHVTFKEEINNMFTWDILKKIIGNKVDGIIYAQTQDYFTLKDKIILIYKQMEEEIRERIEWRLRF